MCFLLCLAKCSLRVNDILQPGYPVHWNTLPLLDRLLLGFEPLVLFEDDDAADSVDEEDEMVDIVDTVEWVALVTVGVNCGNEDKALVLLLVLLLLLLLVILLTLLVSGGGALKEGKG